MGGGLRVWARRPHSEGAGVPWGGSAGARPASVVSVQRGELVPARPEEGRLTRKSLTGRATGGSDRAEKYRRGRQGGKSEGASGRGGSRAGQGASPVEPRRGRRGERCRGKTGSNLVFPQREIIPNASKRPSAQGVGKGFLCHNPGHPEREGGCVPRRTHTQTCTSKENPCCDKNDKPGDAFATRFYHRQVADVPNI